MNLNQEEIAIINRAFEQLPFASPFGSMPLEEPLDAEAKRYVLRVSDTSFPELFDKNGEANNFVDRRQAEEVLRFCSFFENCRQNYKKETLNDRRKQVEIFKEVMPYLDKENRKIAINRVAFLENDLPENIFARGIKPFVSFTEIDRALAAFEGEIPENIKKTYNEVVMNSVLGRIEEISQHQSIAYVSDFDVKDAFNLKSRLSQEDQVLIQKKLTDAIIGQFEKGFKSLSEKEKDLKKRKGDVKYEREKRELEIEALNYAKQFCKYASFMTSQLKTSPKMETLCNYALKAVGIATPAHSAASFELKAKICLSQEEAYKKIPNDNLAELLSKAYNCDRRMYCIDADLARYSRVEKNAQISTRVNEGNRHRDIMDEKRRIVEQINFYRRKQSREGYTHV